MQEFKIERLLSHILKSGLLLVVAVTPLIVVSSMFFPYITGKNFFFRIIVDLLFGVWLALAYANPAYRPRRGYILWALGAFVTWISLAALFGADPYHSFWSNFERMEGLITHLHLFAFFIMLVSVFRTEARWTSFFHVSIGGSIIVALYGLLEKLGTITPGGSVAGSAGAGRIFATLGNPIYLAVYMLFHLFILAYLFFRTDKVWLRVVYAGAGLFEFFIFIATGTRGAVLGLVSGLFVGALVLLITSSQKYVRFAGAGILILLLGGAISLSQFRGTSFISSNPLLTRLADISLSSSTVQSRFKIWEIALSAARERPIMGWGQENFIIPYGKYYDANLYGNEPWFDRAHNMFLEWLVAGGVVGLVLYLLLFGVSFFVLWRLWRRGNISSITAALFAGLLTAYLTQNIFVFDNIVTYLLVFMVLAFLHVIYTEAEFQSVVSSGKEPARRSVLNVLPFCIAFGIIVAIMLNATPVKVARGIITALNATQSGNVQDFLDAYDKVSKLGTFGQTEARERIADLVIQTFQSGQQVRPDVVPLMNKAIEEVRKETTDHPESLRHLITEGKLLQLRFSVITQNEKDRDDAIAAYQKAINVASHYPPSYIGLTEVYLAAGNPQKATETISTITREITSPNPLFHTNLIVHAITGDFDGGINEIHGYLEQIRRGHTLIPRDDKQEDVLRGENNVAVTYLEPDMVWDVARRSLVGGDPAKRKEFLLALQDGLFIQDDAVVFLALAETDAQLGLKDEARMYATRAGEIAPQYKDQVDTFLTNLEKLPE